MQTRTGKAEPAMSPAPHLSRRGLLAAGAATAALPLLAPSAAAARPAGASGSAGAAGSTPYTFRNAEIVGGGFVTGMSTGGTRTP